MKCRFRYLNKAKIIGNKVGNNIIEEENRTMRIIYIYG